MANEYVGPILAQPTEYTGQVMGAENQQQSVNADTPWGEVLTQAGFNIPSSGKKYVGSIVEAIKHPIQTATTVSDLGAGAVISMMPESMISYLGPTGMRVLFGERNKEMKQLANAVGKHYVNTYGSLDGFKKAVAEDPVAILGDAATIIGGLGAATKSPKIAAIAAAIDPVNASIWAAQQTRRGAGNVTASVLGKSTGTGTAPVIEAYQAGRQGGAAAEQLTGQMRGTSPMTEPLTIARRNVERVRQQRAQDYRSGMVNISNDKSILVFDDIDNALISALDKTNFRGVTKNTKAADALQSAAEIIAEWKRLDPAQYHTPEGFDALKQRIGGVLETIPYPEATSRTVVQGLYDSVKSTVTKQAPEYAKVMKEYQNMSELLEEIQKTLSLNPRASVDTSMRKLQSLMRNNANTNYGQRTATANTLEQLGGESMMPSLAGQALSEWTPRGIQGALTLPAGVSAFELGSYPLLAGYAAVSSPRLVGETAYAAGQGVRLANQASQYIPAPVRAAATDPLTRNLLNQAGRLEQRK